LTFKSDLTLSRFIGFSERNVRCVSNSPTIYLGHLFIEHAVQHHFTALCRAGRHPSDIISSSLDRPSPFSASPLPRPNFQRTFIAFKACKVGYTKPDLEKSSLMNFILIMGTHTHIEVKVKRDIVVFLLFSR